MGYVLYLTVFHNIFDLYHSGSKNRFSGGQRWLKMHLFKDFALLNHFWYLLSLKISWKPCPNFLEVILAMCTARLETFQGIRIAVTKQGVIKTEKMLLHDFFSATLKRNISSIYKAIVKTPYYNHFTEEALSQNLKLLKSLII